MSALDAALALAHEDEMMAWECARALLNKLTVPELRVLYRHYLKMDAEKELKKADLLDDIVPEYVEGEYFL